MWGGTSVLPDLIMFSREARNLDILKVTPLIFQCFNIAKTQWTKRKYISGPYLALRLPINNVWFGRLRRCCSESNVKRQVPKRSTACPCLLTAATWGLQRPGQEHTAWMGCAVQAQVPSDLSSSSLTPGFSPERQIPMFSCLLTMSPWRSDRFLHMPTSAPRLDSFLHAWVFPNAKWHHYIPGAHAKKGDFLSFLTPYPAHQEVLSMPYSNRSQTRPFSPPFITTSPV